MTQQLKEHILALFKMGSRLDGRKADDYRKPLHIDYGVTKTAEGSATVTLGETIVMAGVKLEIMQPYPDTPDEGTLMVGAELLPLSSPDFESGPPSTFAVELGRVCDRGIRESHALDFKKLCITPGEKAWTVVIDICPINDAGNLFDASALACLAALKDTVLPAYDGKNIDYKTKTKEKLPLVHLPIAVTVHKLGDNLFVDPVSDEEKNSDSRLTITVTEDGNLCSLQKGGDGVLSVEEIEKMISIALKKNVELRKAL